MTHEFIGNKVLNLSAMTTAEWKQATWFDSFSIAGSVQYHLMSIAEWSPHPVLFGGPAMSRAEKSCPKQSTCLRGQQSTNKYIEK